MTRIWDKFEYKAVVCFTGYIDRYASLRNEFERVGLTNVHPHWDFPNPYHQVLLKTVPMTRYNSHRACFKIGMNNYRAIATAFHLGCQNCLVMEDDVRFLKDIDKIVEVLSGLPDDYDLALLDNNKPCALSPEAYCNVFKNPVAPHWFRFTNLRSTGCYSMSRRCMERYLKLFEAPAEMRGVLRNPDGYFRVECLGNDANLYVSNPPIALQKIFTTTHCSSMRMNEYYVLHEKIGAPADIYNM